MLSRQLIIYFLLCVVAILMVKEFSFSPETFTGNGNPVILIFPFVLLTFGLFGYELFLRLKEASFKKSAWRNVVICSFIFFLAASMLEFEYFNELIQKLGGTPTNEESRIYHFPWLNQYTNTIFVNFYTFLIYASTLTLFISFYQWLKN
ncbi:hypothetical protein QNH48_04280 [Neobacillus sp. YX16]|uniref:hypothetical protein n=1 Tax=Neobacillus sp. YX16 TaxID=3047874 RepID=UPI0024C382DA|nr:hypothetical protein [Neobacillus sp. YX16]WHZ03886.1 hypothetical protein QNH48_04280 [Neobacillus sp. YX16]